MDSSSRDHAPLTEAGQGNPTLAASDAELSFDAKILAGALFGIMMTEVTFHMVESQPTARTQAALDEMVCKGALTCKPFNSLGAVSYKPTRQFWDEWKFVGGMRDKDPGAMTFAITEPRVGTGRDPSPPVISDAVPGTNQRTTP